MCAPLEQKLLIVYITYSKYKTVSNSTLTAKCTTTFHTHIDKNTNTHSSRLSHDIRHLTKIWMQGVSQPEERKHDTYAVFWLCVPCIVDVVVETMVACEKNWSKRLWLYANVSRLK